ncbi:MAG: transglutaminase family protein [bacterium]|nr:transglutaminase family protein [bacterium]
MAIRVALHHETRYRYDRPVRLGAQSIRLRPAVHARTPIHAYSLRIEPESHFLNWQQDPQGNFLARVVVPEPTTSFRVVVDLVAELAIRNPFDFFLEESAGHHPFDYEAALEKELAPFLEKEPAPPVLRRWLRGVPTAKRPTVDFLVDLNQRLEREIRYLIRMEPGVQSPEETLTTKSGSCRDSAWLLVQILRHLGLAARFTSGYLIQLTPDVRSLDGPSGTDHDFTDLHAWAEVYLPGAGWIGLDPTSGLLAGEGHIPVACSPFPGSAAPISGGLEPCEVEFEHAMHVERIAETPRVTKPYSDDAWEAVDALGRAVDARLDAGDVRLTMGGEPTFVSIDDMQGEEWNTEAIGPNKRALAEDLTRRLRSRFAPGALLHCGQGKWYPGEALPRWAFSVYWREDGVPLWRNEALLGDERAPRPPTLDQTEAFARQAAEELGIEPDFAVPAFEDPLVLLETEAGLPVGLDPSRADLDAPAERARLARTLSEGAQTPAAFVLPVQAWNARDQGRAWRSEAWPTRRGRLFLVSGDSPAGFRLPLDALPFLPESRYPHVMAADPTRHLAALPVPLRQRPTRGGRGGSPAPPPNGPSTAAGGSPVRTALVFESRDGHLNAFLPPVESGDDFVLLVAALERAAEKIDVPVRIEGYPPPPDARIEHFKITPDPGVIEVNVHPSASWTELVDRTQVLYEEARAARLGTEKFLLDGRHSGTGGGNHVVVGGPTPLDSPFLRRPDLLASLLGAWIDHPSLSYLFSGLFIGPTSQAPRVDEARHDALYELDIALAQLHAAAPAPPPWLVDRCLRNLLVDVTGNTHRAEICIDKLYSPDSSMGRLGLVEFRAFEMPPHARMSLVQQLLLRALIARFWEAPRPSPLTRWGTALHDRFMLPHFVWVDFLHVLEDLREHGFDFDPEWFRAHFEFRFPRFGSFRYDDVEVEVRQALEPWHVLGEEGTTGGTARFVDSSLERLQLRTTGLIGDRWVLACNGIRVPLHRTARQDEAVAGVRYRAWQPAHCLHPTIPVHSPLTFDLVDTWSGRAVAGARYHVGHPGGRNHERFPVNAFEAEGRRLARFESGGHTPGAMQPAPWEPDPEFPMTLDLRRVATGRGR